MKKKRNFGKQFGPICHWSSVNVLPSEKEEGKNRVWCMVRWMVRRVGTGAGEVNGKEGVERKKKRIEKKRKWYGGSGGGGAGG